MNFANWAAAAMAVLGMSGAAGAAEYMEKTDFQKSRAFSPAVITQGGEDLDYSAARQETMALSSIVAAMKALGFANETQAKSLNDALGPVFDAVGDDQAYSPDTFLQALRQFQAKLPP